MYKPQEDVADFMNMCGQEVKTSPGIPSREILLLRAKLSFEETMEFIKEAGCYVTCDDEGDFDIHIDHKATPDLVGMYDGLIDMNYVSYGALNALGLSAELGHAEVQRSNMSKVSPDGTIHKNEFGKVIKPANYSPADLKTVVENQVK